MDIRNLGEFVEQNAGKDPVKLAEEAALASRLADSAVKKAAVYDSSLVPSAGNLEDAYQDYVESNGGNEPEFEVLQGACEILAIHWVHSDTTQIWPRFNDLVRP